MIEIRRLALFMSGNVHADSFVEGLCRLKGARR